MKEQRCSHLPIDEQCSTCQSPEEEMDTVVGNEGKSIFNVLFLSTSENMVLCNIPQAAAIAGEQAEHHQPNWEGEALQDKL